MCYGVPGTGRHIVATIDSFLMCFYPDASKISSLSDFGDRGFGVPFEEETAGAQSLL